MTAINWLGKPALFAEIQHYTWHYFLHKLLYYIKRFTLLHLLCGFKFLSRILYVNVV